MVWMHFNFVYLSRTTTVNGPLALVQDRYYDPGSNFLMLPTIDSSSQRGVKLFLLLWFLEPVRFD